MRTRQRNIGRCECGRPILTGHLRKYNGGNGVCGACNAEAQIAEVLGGQNNQDSNSVDSDRDAG